MNSLINDLFKIISNGDPEVKSSVEKIAGTFLQSVAQNTNETSTQKLEVSEVTKSAQYGDVIGVNREGYKHFGIYLNDECIIHYASLSGDFGQDMCVHETTLEKFLGSSDNYFVYEFANDIEDKIEKIYSPEETVKRAKSRMNEAQYNLISNNCEHFAVWCKTGISKSYQVNNFAQYMQTTMNDK